MDRRKKGEFSNIRYTAVCLLLYLTNFYRLNLTVTLLDYCVSDTSKIRSKPVSQNVRSEVRKSKKIDRQIDNVYVNKSKYENKS